MNENIIISKKYSLEANIHNKLNQLEKGRVYELTKAKIDATYQQLLI